MINKKFYVYKHTSPSNKCYIGITSNSLNQRWGNNGNRYLYKNSDGKFKHPLFANAILKYGWDHFTHEILLEGRSESEAKYAEKYLIKWYRMHEGCYNLTDGGDGTTGYKFSEEVIEKHRQSLIGKKLSKETVEKIVKKNIGKIRTDEQKAKSSIPVIQYTKELEFVAEYFGVNEASRKTGINNAHINECCNNKRKSAGGFIWTWKSNDRIRKTSYKVEQYDINKKLLHVWDSIQQVVNEYNIGRTALWYYSDNEKPDKNNFIWKIIT